MTNCKSCSKPVTKNSPGLQCKGFCGAVYHANNTCSDVNKQQFATISSLPGTQWLCSTCRLQDRCQARTKSSSEIEDEFITNSDIAGGMNSMPEFMRMIRTEMQLLRKSVEFCSDKISDFEAKIVEINDYFKATDKLRAETSKLCGDVANLSKKVNYLEQSLRSNNVEIQDIPEKADENLISLIAKIGNSINFEVKPAKIDTVFRVPTLVEKKPKNIVIKFLSKCDRDGFLIAAKTARKIPGNKYGFNLTGVSDKFYINEHLAPQTKLLLKQTREKAKERNFKFTWVQNGNVLVRQTEKSKIIQITDVSDLGKI